MDWSGSNGSPPPSLTSFVGRDDERARLDDLLAPGTVVTLTGAGGSGKTRLAVELAHSRHGRQPVHFVALAPIDGPGLVATSVASALGMREEARRSVADAVVDRLRSGAASLLVLDNCEHVIDGVRELLARVVADGGDVTVVATSREPLRVPGEHVWPVSPLPVPDGAAGAAEVRASPAVRLFCDRAQQARADFELPDEVMPAVARLCRQLGGLPLAIELVAPWVRVLSLEEISSRVHQLMRLPASSVDDDRHRSVEAALAWSVERLSPVEHRLFRRLASFAGGCSLEAVEAVADDVGPVLEVLASLVDKGLVEVDGTASGRTRYRLLEPIREHAARLLEGSGEAASVTDRYLGFFLDLAVTAERHLHVHTQVAWLARLDEEHANLRNAYERAIGGGRADVALRLAGALWWYWWLRGHVEEGARRLQRALEAAREPTADRAVALIGLAGFLLLRGEYEEADAMATRSAGICEASGDVLGLARAIGTRARIHSTAGDLGTAERLGGLALSMYEDLGHEGGAAWMRLVLMEALAARASDEEYRTSVQRAKVSFERRGDRWGLGWALVAEADLHLADEAAEQAQLLADRALEAFAECGNRDEAVVCAVALRAEARLRLDGPRAALEDATEALELGRWTGDSSALSLALTVAGRVATEAGDPLTGAELLGAAQQSQHRPPHIGRTTFQRLEQQLHDELGADDLAAALARGGARRSETLLHMVGRAVDRQERQGAARLRIPEVDEAALVREGDYWTVRLGDEMSRVADVKGLRYLSYVLAHPDREFHVLDLVAQVEGTSTDQMDRGDAGPLLDARAKAAYRKRLDELEEELDDARELGDAFRADRLRTERDALTSELAAAVGLGGRDRRAAAASERARVNVTRLIGTAVRKIEDAGCPNVAHLLRSTVRTGTYCAYEPPPSGGPTWSLRSDRGPAAVR